MGWFDDTVDSAKKVGSGDVSGLQGLGKSFVDLHTLGMGSKVGEQIDKNFISGDWNKKNELADEQAALNSGVNKNIDDSLNKQQSIQSEFSAKRDAEFGNLDTKDDTFLNDTKDLRGQAEKSGKDASVVYDNMSQKYGTAQDTADNEAKSAMSLKDYMNPNNKVATDTRNLYNAEGAIQQGIYNTQAGNEDRQGQASFGVLSSLGASAMGAQMGGMGPLTVGQQMAMQAQGQRQAGEAYSNVQRRMQGLRDQGLQANLSNRNRGMDAGFERTDAAYNAGQDAKDRQENLMRDRRGLENEFRNFQMNNRGEVNGFNTNIHAVDTGKTTRRISAASEDRDMNMQGQASRIAEQMRRAGVGEAAIAAKLAEMQSQLAGRQAIVGGVAKLGGTVAGAYFGGPQGAAAGGAAGGAVADMGTAAAAPQPAAPRTVPQSAPVGVWNGGDTGVPSHGQPVAQNTFGNYLTKKYNSPYPRTMQG
jgi:hypothetical protein